MLLFVIRALHCYLFNFGGGFVYACICMYLSPFRRRSASQHGYLANSGSFIDLDHCCLCVCMGICVLFAVAFFGNSFNMPKRIHFFTDFIRTLFVHQWAQAATLAMGWQVNDCHYLQYSFQITIIHQK